MVVDFTLLTVLIPALLGIAIGLFSGSVYIGGGAFAVILGWTAVKTQNSFTVGLWFLILLLMTLASGKRMADMLLGDTA